MGLSNRALLNSLATTHAPRQVLEYGPAIRTMREELDARGSVVRDVYTGRTVEVASIGSGSKVTLNAEHTWPRSLGVVDTPAVCDLHHIFPVDAVANATRGNLPFGEVETVSWSTGGSARGLDASGVEVFEPPDAHKGNVARALFYVSTVYGLRIDDAQEATLKAWHALDPPDADEVARNDRVEQLQGNRNPFVDDPALAQRIDDF